MANLTGRIAVVSIGWTTGRFEQEKSTDRREKTNGAQQSAKYTVRSAWCGGWGCDFNDLEGRTMWLVQVGFGLFYFFAK
jgi:hypothetical protein